MNDSPSIEIGQTALTPEVNKWWLDNYPHDQERDERLESLLDLARSLECRLHVGPAVS